VRRIIVETGRVTGRGGITRRVGLATLAASVALGEEPASAFPHVLMPNETLADVASHAYGRVELEQVLVAANGLDLGGPGAVVPGTRIEVPIVGYHRVSQGDSWEELAARYLGDKKRGEVLARVNEALIWVPPSPGRELLIPYNLRYVVKAGDSTMTIAYRFLGKRDEAYVIDRYNDLGGHPVERGDVLLVPLTDLPLSDAGREEAAEVSGLVRGAKASVTHDAQQLVDTELPELSARLRDGRWLEAVAKGNELLGYGDLADPQLAGIHRVLLEAYVALDSGPLATTACAEWRRADPEAELDPVWISPKMLKACADAAASRR